MDFQGPVTRKSTCFERNMSYMQQGINLIAEARDSRDLDASHIPVDTFEAYLVELTHYRSRCRDMSQEQQRTFDSKMEDFVNHYRLLLRSIARNN